MGTVKITGVSIMQDRSLRLRPVRVVVATKAIPCDRVAVASARVMRAIACPRVLVRDEERVVTVESRVATVKSMVRLVDAHPHPV